MLDPQPIPPFVIEYFLLGRTRKDAIERYTQDGGIVSDVWLEFARDRSAALRVLVAPCAEVPTIDLGYALHKAISDYRISHPDGNRKPTNVSPLENFVAVTLYFDELIRVVLPFTTWWRSKNLGAIRNKAIDHGQHLEEKLEKAILNKLGHNHDEFVLRKGLPNTEESLIDRRVIEAAPLAALIGVFRLADQSPAEFDELRLLDPKDREFDKKFVAWVHAHAEPIAHAARNEFTEQVQSSTPALKQNLSMRMQSQVDLSPDEAPELIQRVFLDRRATLATQAALEASLEANSTVKADAATRVFDVSCSTISWAIIDSGIATTHPAFLDHNARDRRGRPLSHPVSRIRDTLDFTLIDQIKNFDLTSSPDGTPARAAEIARVAQELQNLPGRTADATFVPMAIETLEIIARQLDQRIPPDWNLIERLIRIGNNDDGAQLVSDHGTHVAGILGADWRSDRVAPNGEKERVLQGICPDIRLYDLRVIHRVSRQSTEFAVLAALEYVQFANMRAASNGPVIHGVNISLSLAHDVRTYGCGATPVCVACDRLVGAGVVVVAAAGNRGWNEMEAGYGNFQFCSITDPGNAREVITVGATHRGKPHTYGVSYFSSRGPTGDGRIKPDLVAPGEQIRGPIRGDADDEFDGTSMAAPFVCGAAAMLLARNRELIGNPQRIKQILCDSATDLGREKYFQGHGLLDVLRAMQSL